MEDYAPLFSEENLLLLEIFDETFNIWPISDDFHNNSSYCEKFINIFFEEILIVDKTRKWKDLIFFHVWLN